MLGRAVAFVKQPAAVVRVSDMRRYRQLRSLKAARAAVADHAFVFIQQV